MSFSLPEDLAPELYPLAWLVGRWRGPGALSYPDIPERGIVQDVVIDHDGGPYLTYSATTYLLEGEQIRHEADFDPAELSTGQIWATETGFWRPVVSGKPAEPVAGAPADGPPPTAVELLLAEPTGHVSIHVGSVQGPRIDLATDWLARTSTAADVVAQRRMYGWVHGTIFWAQDLAAFGHELQTYATGRLARFEPPAESR